MENEGSLIQSQFLNFSTTTCGTKSNHGIKAKEEGMGKELSIGYKGIDNSFFKPFSLFLSRASDVRSIMETTSISKLRRLTLHILSIRKNIEILLYILSRSPNLQELNIIFTESTPKLISLNVLRDNEVEHQEIFDKILTFKVAYPTAVIQFHSILDSSIGLMTIMDKALAKLKMLLFFVYCD
ncbi:hypothetical protein M9H77_28141 [Catharanthus roseus]|uniref:Uncharacterized protein n=1 Tax=Catharanthus roseus TaxID=4058 RepID=A0ACC0AIT0_CATRO|nr:hypothetical protein M9H77_28141 [Catharanthus roseus]